MKTSEKDWKLFSSCIVGWQEAYMDKMNQSYIEILTDNGTAPPEKFHSLYKKMNSDYRSPGVLVERKRSKLVENLVLLISNGVIELGDLSDFSPELQETVKFNLSGGEQQKIAIARAIAKQCEIIVMDEPSSALDPVAEQRLTDNISKYVKDKTVIYISHRLSTTKDVDCIYVLDEGRIVESGSHSQLMKLNGKYAKMFLTQSQKYLKKET